MSSGARAARDVQALVDAGKVGGIRRVFTLTEGVFPYPLDDLWAMRTHAMVAMVEAHVLAHLKDVLVWPHGDGVSVSHYSKDDLPYVQEMLRLKGVYAPGRVHTVAVGKSGHTILQASQTSLLPCPAPQWHDFRMA